MAESTLEKNILPIKERFFSEYNIKYPGKIHRVDYHVSEGTPYLTVFLSYNDHKIASQLFPEVYDAINITFTIAETISTVFLLPGIEIKNNIKDQFYNFGFKNTFLTCPPLTYPFEVLFLLFKPVDIDLDFIRFGEELHRNPNFLETIDGGGNKVLFVYRIPKRYRHDYQLFLQGKYSKTSADFKKCFVMEQFKLDANGKPVLEKGRYVKEYTDFYHIFNRTDFIKSIWNERLGYSENDHILDSIEYYDIQKPEDETLIEEFWLG